MPSMSTLTKKQKEIFDFIESYNKRHGVSPTFEEISKHIGKAFSTVHEHVEALIEKGFLLKNSNASRGIELNKIEEMVKIPLLGTIVAGQPIGVVQEREVIAIPKNKLPKKGNAFALRVSGDSMIEENINDGDYVIVKQQPTAENGQKVVALIDNDEVTLKKFYREKKGVRLQPANQTMLPLFFDNARVDIQGVVLDIIKSNGESDKTDIEEKEQKAHSIVPTKISILNPQKIKITSAYQKDANAILFHGDRLKFLSTLPEKSARLVVTSPPYNIGKEYEKRRDLGAYLKDQEDTIRESVRVLADNGSLCWQVGNHIGTDGEVFPLDILIYPIA